MARNAHSDEVAVSQGRLIWRRFLKNRISVVSAILFLLVILFALTAVGIGPIPGWWRFDYSQLNDQLNQGEPTLSLWPFSIGEHPFGQDRIGRDYFAMTMRGVENSALVMVVLGGMAAILGVVVGAISGYYRGWLDSLLMRITDVFIVIPALVIGSVVGNWAGNLGAPALAIMLGLFSWMGIARLVRGEFLVLRERPFVEAAKVAGASDTRIIFKHILPNAMGTVIVSATLIMATAILLETALSFLGYGIKAPDVSLGGLVSSNEAAFQTRPWLFWWPASFIVGLALLVNFVGDGLRDAFDPRHKVFKISKIRDLPDSIDSDGTTAEPEDGLGVIGRSM